MGREAKPQNLDQTGALLPLFSTLFAWCVMHPFMCFLHAAKRGKLHAGFLFAKLLGNSCTTVPFCVGGGRLRLLQLKFSISLPLLLIILLLLLNGFCGLENSSYLWLWKKSRTSLKLLPCLKTRYHAKCCFCWQQSIRLSLMIIIWWEYFIFNNI